MLKQPLGKLMSVNLQDVWETEAGGFTPWLAAHIGILADAIGLELENPEKEKQVGAFSADILCKDASDGSLVVVENQMGKSDHKHLGQILTYATGLHAKTVVWIAREFREEHRAALDLLNANMKEEYRFFGLEVELWKIGDSKPAPKLSVVVSPNDWSKDVFRASKGEMSESEARWLLYWTEFAKYLDESAFHLSARKPRPSNWMNFAVGRSGVKISACWKNSGRRLEVQLRATDQNAEAFYGLLAEEAQAIDRQIGFSLDWEAGRPASGKKRAYICAGKDDADIKVKSKWKNQHQWLADTVRKFDSVFRERVKELNPEDWDANQEND